MPLLPVDVLNFLTAAILFLAMLIGIVLHWIWWKAGQQNARLHQAAVAESLKQMEHSQRQQARFDEQQEQAQRLQDRLGALLDQEERLVERAETLLKRFEERLS